MKIQQDAHYPLLHLFKDRLEREMLRDHMSLQTTDRQGSDGISFALPEMRILAQTRVMNCGRCLLHKQKEY